MTDPNRAMTLIHQAETDHRLFEPAVTDFCLWPIVRYRAWQIVARIEPEVMNRTLWQRVRAQPYAWSIPFWATWSAIQRRRLRGGKRDIALLSHEAYRTVKRRDGWWDVYLDDIATHASIRDRVLRLETRAFAWTPWRTPAPRHLFTDGERLHQVLRRGGADTVAAADAGGRQAAVFRALMGELGEPLDDAQAGALARSCVRFAKLFVRSCAWYEKLLADLSPRVLVVLSAYTRHGVVAAARRLGIPVYEFQHGIIHRLHTGYIWGAHLRDLGERLPLPDHLATYGDYWSRILLDSGFWKRDQVHDIGSARMDWLRARTSPNGTHGGSDRRVQIIFTTQHPTRENAIRLLREFVDQARAARFDLHLIVKVHRREGPFLGEYRVLSEGCPSVSVLSAYEGDTLSLIAESDVHVSGWSTCHYEALGLGTPTIVVQFPGGVETTDLYNLPAVSRAASAGELLDAVKRVTSGAGVDVGAVSEDLFKSNAVDNAAALLREA